MFHDELQMIQYYYLLSFSYQDEQLRAHKQSITKVQPSNQVRHVSYFCNLQKHVSSNQII